MTPIFKFTYVSNKSSVEILPALACRSKLTAKRGMPAEQTFLNKFRTAGDQPYKQSLLNLFMLPGAASI
jgi:hypothetical protein